MLLGHWPETSITEARDAAVEARRDVRENRDPLLTRNESRDLRTVHELAQEYLEKHAERYKRESSLDDRPLHVLQRHRPKLGDLSVPSVTREHIQKLHADLEVTPYRANRVLALLRKTFNLAIEGTHEPGWCSTNPRPRRGKCTPRKTLALARRERDQAAANRTALLRGSKSANAIQLIALTGSRKGEALQAKWADIDFTSTASGDIRSTREGTEARGICPAQF